MKTVFVDQIGKINNKYSFELCNNMNNIDITIITDDENDMEGCKVTYKRFFRNFAKDKNPIIKAINYIKAYKKIIKFCSIEKVDILHIQWFIFSPVDYYFIKKIKNKNIKIVATVHDIMPFNKKFYDYRYHKKLYDICDQIIVQAKINVDRLKNEFNIDDKRINYIPHGNFVDFSETVDQMEARKKLNLPLDKSIILFFGQIKKVKGLGTLIEAFNNVVKQRKDVYLLIAGKVWKDNFEYYQNMIDNYKLNDYIRCDIKYIPDDEIKYYFNSCDFSVLPYLDVFQSGVVQLTYAYSKAAIVTNVGGLPEVVVNNKTGKVIAPNNPNQLADAINEFLDNKDIVNQMGIEGKKFVEDKFSWIKISDQTKNVYLK